MRGAVIKGSEYRYSANINIFDVAKIRLIVANAIAFKAQLREADCFSGQGAHINDTVIPLVSREAGKVSARMCFDAICIDDALTVKVAQSRTIAAHEVNRRLLRRARRGYPHVVLQ